MMTDERRTFKCIETPFRHFIQGILREKDKVWNREYFNIIRF